MTTMGNGSIGTGSGVSFALSDEQIPQRVDDFAAIEAVDSNGSLLLHGAFMGLEYRF